ncbi:polysaccharide deacetylase family protein [Sphingobacterium sp. MYb382]|uniref:polysaccharide deacetylase family protein n=1 Tax=Sphingobacterium sp. MYb382 TaxID=2745278 RepID=UPI0030A008D6
MMLKGVRGLSKLGIILVAANLLVSCGGGTTSKAAHSADDTIGKEQTVKQDTLAKGKLLTRLKDSAKQQVDTVGLVKVKKDSVLRVVKAEKRRVKDSVRQELDKLPKHIFFTFDDGPLRGSAAIDSIAKAKNINISVFLIGKHANMSKGLKRDYQRYYNNPLVECYNHSYTHANNKFTTFYSNPVAAFADFEKNEKDLQLKHKIIRLPGRNISMYDDVRRIDLQSGVSTADLLFADGYKIYGWDVEWKIHGLTGKPLQSVGEIYNRIRNYMNNKSSMEPNNVILLMHDDMFQNKKGQDLLSALIDTIQRNTDYKFEFMRNYPFRY